MSFYGPPVSLEELRRRQQQQQLASQLASQHPDESAAPAPDTLMLGGESLDDIIRDNADELLRRRSVPHRYAGSASSRGSGRRPLSMLDFDGSGPFSDLHFANAAASGDDDPMTGSYGMMMADMALDDPAAPFPPQDLMAMSDADFPPLSADTMMGNTMPFPELDMGQMQLDPTSPLDLFAPAGIPGPFPANPLHPVLPGFAVDTTIDNDPLSAASAEPPTRIAMGAHDGMAAGVERRFDAAEDLHVPRGPQIQSPRPGPVRETLGPGVPPTSRESSEPASLRPAGPSALQAPPAVPRRTSGPTPAATATTSATAVSTPASAVAGPSPHDVQQKNVYSRSGFDMLKALWYVATRKNPEVQLGAVDMSCSFVVCDVTLNDCPIIYVSDNFQNLTGYSRHEILGQNCRFLQAPDGRVELGSKREFVENSTVYTLKRKVEERREVQLSLINYRKGGKPFLNLITLIPIPWDTEEIRYFIGFQIDLVECPEAISGHHAGGVMVNYKHSDIGQYIWTPPAAGDWDQESGQTMGIDEVSTLLQQCNPRGALSDWYKQTWDKMLLENMDDVVHVLSLKGLFLYLSPSCKKILEYDSADLVGSSLSSICHPSDIVPVMRELKDTAAGSTVNIVFRIRRKQSGYTWFESRGSLFVEQGKGRKCVILVGRRRPVIALRRRDLEAHGGIGDSEIWTKLSTSGIFLFVSSNVRSLLDLLPEHLEGTNIQDLMRKESRSEFGRSIEKARRGKIVTCKHEVQNKRGQVLQAQTTLYPGDAADGSKPLFLLAQTKLLKASLRGSAASLSSDGRARSGAANAPAGGPSTPLGVLHASTANTINKLAPSDGNAAAEAAAASDENLFDELKTTRCTSWQYELRQMEKMNRVLAEELAQLLSNKKKRKRRKGSGNMVRDCANCHTRNTPEWRRGPSGKRDLCNSCGLRWAKQVGRVSPRNSSRSGTAHVHGGNGDPPSEKSSSPAHSSPLHRDSSMDSQHGGFSGASDVSSTGTQGNHGGGNGNGGGANSANPPQSQPLLEGGSGLGGGGMSMTSIPE